MRFSSLEQVAEAVFRQTHIAQSTHEFTNVEHEQLKMDSGVEGVYYQKILGIQPVKKPQTAESEEQEVIPRDEPAQNSEDAEDSSSDESEDSDEDEDSESEDKVRQHQVLERKDWIIESLGL